MATTFCPGCSKSLSAAEKATGHCPSCGKPLPGLASATNAPPPLRLAPRSQPRPVRVEEEAAGIPRSVLGWGTVRAGLAQTVVGSILFALASLILYVIRMSALEGHGTNMLIVVILSLGLAGVLAGVLTAVVGSFMGCAAPTESGARGWAIAYSTFMTLSLILTAVLFIAEREKEYAFQQRIEVGSRLDGVAPGWQAKELRLVSYLSRGSGLLAPVFFLLFLRAAASFFQRNALALGVVCYLAFYLLCGTGLFLLSIGALDLDSLPIRVERLPYLCTGIVVTLSVWGVVLVGLVRGAVTRGLLQS